MASKNGASLTTTSQLPSVVSSSTRIISSLFSGIGSDIGFSGGNRGRGGRSSGSRGGCSIGSNQSALATPVEAYTLSCLNDQEKHVA